MVWKQLMMVTNQMGESRRAHNDNVPLLSYSVGDSCDLHRQSPRNAGGPHSWGNNH